MEITALNRPLLHSTTTICLQAKTHITFSFKKQNTNAYKTTPPAKKKKTMQRNCNVFPSKLWDCCMWWGRTTTCGHCRHVKDRSKHQKKMMFLSRKYLHTGGEGADLPISQKIPALKQENLSQSVLCLKNKYNHRRGKIFLYIQLFLLGGKSRSGFFLCFNTLFFNLGLHFQTFKPAAKYRLYWHLHHNPASSSSKFHVKRVTLSGERGYFISFH